jgi:hypothetical protein
MAPDGTDLWQLFDLPASATAAQLRQAYRDLMLVWHPDRMPERLRPLATEKVKRLNLAYEALSARLELPAQPEVPSFEDVLRERYEALMTVLQMACARCAGTGSLAMRVSATGHFVMDACPPCEGAGTLICLAGSRCLACAGTGKDPKASLLPRTAYIRDHLGALQKHSVAYRVRYRRLWVRYENTVRLCAACAGSGFTFFRPDRRQEGRGPRRGQDGRPGPERRKRAPVAV